MPPQFFELYLLFFKSGSPRLEMKIAGVPPLVLREVPVRRKALEIRVKLERESRVTGGDQVVIDDLGTFAGVARTDMARHTSAGSLNEVFGINEAGR